MLRKQPRVETAVVTIVNGSRFFDVYIPSLGLEARINTSEIVPAVEARWNADLRYASCRAVESNVEVLDLLARLSLLPLLLLSSNNCSKAE